MLWFLFILSHMLGAEEFCQLLDLNQEYCSSPLPLVNSNPDFTFLVKRMSDFCALLSFTVSPSGKLDSIRQGQFLSQQCNRGKSLPSLVLQLQYLIIQGTLWRWEQRWTQRERRQISCRTFTRNKPQEHKREPTREYWEKPNWRLALIWTCLNGS